MAGQLSPSISRKLEEVHLAYADGLVNDVVKADPEILSFIVSGTWVWLDSISLQQYRAPLSWDGFILVKTKDDIRRLVMQGRQRLLKLTGIVQQECPDMEFEVPGPHSDTWFEIDAVRFAGYDSCRHLRSFIIMGLDYFRKSTISPPRMRSETAINIYSYRDQRVYKNNQDGRIVCRIALGSRLPNGFTILYDQWVFEDWHKPFDFRRKPADVSLGQTMEIIISGLNLIESEYSGAVTQYLVNFYYIITGERLTTKFLPNSALLSADYAEFIDGFLQGYPIAALSLPAYEAGDVPEPTWGDEALAGDTWSPGRVWEGLPERTLESVPRTAVEWYEAGNIVESKATKSPYESGIIKHFKVVVSDGSGETYKMIRRETPYPGFELERAIDASKYFPWTQVPRISRDNMLFFPINDYENQADIRHRYLWGGCRSWEDAETLLYTEMAKTELILHAYRKSLRDPDVRYQDPSELVESFLEDAANKDGSLARMRYNEIELEPGLGITHKEFWELEWIINGERYPSLDELYDQACVDIEEARNGPVIFGIGDTCAARTMVSPKDVHGARKIVFDNYEGAGYHPLMLDMARTFYYDVFYETINAPRLPDRELPNIAWEVKDNAITVVYTESYGWLSRAIAKVKVRYLLQPLGDELDDAEYDFDQMIIQLSSFMVMFPTLYQDFTGNSEAILPNLINGIVMSQARDVKEFIRRLRVLGFED
ncbi:hypothetical protein F5Y11DRAFT_363840 [Daldinia sp. FL1419]|nr:hypothetical protein F5Y11DRAFT_363840 [Daldinia sp. FL1419]